MKHIILALTLVISAASSYADTLVYDDIFYVEGMGEEGFIATAEDRVFLLSEDSHATIFCPLFRPNRGKLHAYTGRYYPKGTLIGNLTIENCKEINTRLITIAKDGSFSGEIRIETTNGILKAITVNGKPLLIEAQK